MKTTTHTKTSAGFSLALTLGLLTAVPALGQLGVAERAGAKLDNAGRNFRRGIETAIERGRAPIIDRQLLTRVFGRVQWDKGLIGSTIDLEVRNEGTVFLRGEVPTPEAKALAVSLATDTIGVTKVVDELSVVSPMEVETSDMPPSAATIRVRPSRVAPVGPAATIITEPEDPIAPPTSTVPRIDKPTSAVKPALVKPALVKPSLVKPGVSAPPVTSTPDDDGVTITP